MVNFLWIFVAVQIAKSDSVTSFFASGFIHASSSPSHLVIKLGSFQIFSKIWGDIHNLMYSTPPLSMTPEFLMTSSVVDTGGKFAKDINDDGGSKFANDINS
jgi:hypothetical protein